MKKKFGLWLNIVTICLCVCVIAIGVYAATTATLKVQGQIGFHAHDCEVEVSMTQKGYSLGDGTTYQTTPIAVDMDSTTDGVQTTGKVAGNGGEGTISSVNLGEMDFTDLAIEKIPNIVFTMTITNKSAYKVAATVTVDELDNLTYVREYNKGTVATETKTAHGGAVILNASTATPTDDESVTFTITLRVVNPEQDIESLANNLQIIANIIKYDENNLEEIVNINKLKYTLNSTKDSYTVKNIGSDEYNSKKIIESFINGLPVTKTDLSIYAYDSKLVELVLPNTMTEIQDGSFNNVYKLSTINIPSSVTTIGQNVLTSCDVLHTITIPSSVTSIGKGIFAENVLTNLTVDVGNIVYDSRNNCNAIIETATNILVAGCANTLIPDSVTSISEKAFYFCNSLESIVIPDSVTSIGSQAFSLCNSLTSVKILGDVTNIGNDAFKDCNKLSNLYINSATTLKTAVISSEQSKILNNVSNIYLEEHISVSNYGFTRADDKTYIVNDVVYKKYNNLNVNDPIYYIIKEDGAYNNMLALKMGTHESVELEWVAFAVRETDLGTNSYSITNSSGTWYSLCGIDMSNVDVKGKTFYFISRYMTEKTNFYTDYSGSKADLYICDETETGFSYMMNISHHKLFTSTEGGITQRTETTDEPFGPSKFWYLSNNEFNLLKGNNTSIGNVLAKAEKTSGELGSWDAWGIRKNGVVTGIRGFNESSFGNGSSLYVRPAFQITL